MKTRLKSYCSLESMEEGKELYFDDKSCDDHSNAMTEQPSVSSDDIVEANSSNIRRSTRNPSLALLEKREVQLLLYKIRNNDPCTVVLKIKDHILADVNSSVIDAIIEALHENTICQVSYPTLYDEKSM